MRPDVAVAFFVATIVFIMGLFVLIDSTHVVRQDKATPQYELECFYTDENDYIIEIQGIIKGGKKPLSYAYFQLESLGYHSEIYEWKASITIGIDQEFENENFTYVDEDNDGYITKGDYIILRSKGNGGPAEDGMRFRMKFTISGDMFGYLDLTSEITKEIQYPSNNWHFNTSENTKISINMNQSVLHHSTISENDVQKCRLSFENVGNESLNLKIIIRNGNDTIKEQYLFLNKSSEAVVNASFKAFFSNSTTAMNENNSVSIIIINENTTEVLLSVHADYQVNRYASASDSFSMKTGLILLSTYFIVCLFNMYCGLHFDINKKPKK